MTLAPSGFTCLGASLAPQLPCTLDSCGGLTAHATHVPQDLRVESAPQSCSMAWQVGYKCRAKGLTDMNNGLADSAQLNVAETSTWTAGQRHGTEKAVCARGPRTRTAPGVGVWGYPHLRGPCGTLHR